MRRARGRAALLVLLGSLAGCAARDSEADPAPTATVAHDLLASVRRGSITAPDTIAAGWRRLRVEEDGKGHILVVFRLGAAATDADVARLLEALDTATATPTGARALGGPEVGDTGEVVLEFTAGAHLLACLRRGADGHRHAGDGEARTLVVTALAADRSSEPPLSTHELAMVDFAYPGPERWTAGPHLLRVSNDGAQEHQVRIARLRDGVSLRDWLSAEGAAPVDSTIAGVARLGPGAVAYLPVVLTPGAYVAYCLITDPGTGEPHVELGMFKGITVE